MRKIAVPLMYSWAAVIPIALLSIWILNRQVRQAHSGRQVWAMRLSWLPLWSLWLYASFAVVLFATFNEPWPLSLKHGPDTEYAREGFALHAGMPAPPAVTEIYFTSLGVMERHDKLSFQVDDGEVVRKIVEYQGLIAADSLEPGHYGLLDSACIAIKNNRNPNLQCYFRDQGRAHWSLRYDPTTRSVLYEHLSP